MSVTRLIRDGLRFDKFLVASSCRVCLDPYCMVGCPVGSIHRDKNGTVLIEDWCVGCGLCERNCPYGNIKMHETQGRATATARRARDHLRPLRRPRRPTELRLCLPA